MKTSHNGNSKVFHLWFLTWTMDFSSIQEPYVASSSPIEHTEHFRHRKKYLQVQSSGF